MSTLPRLSSRYHDRIELVFRNPANVMEYRVSAHKTLNGAFTGAVPLFSFPVGTHFRSPFIVKKGWGIINESMRGLSRVTFNLNDYQPLNPNIPSDHEVSYLRVEDMVGGVWDSPTAVLVVPPPSFYGTNSPSLTLSGIAPGISAVPGDPPPSNAIMIAMPRTLKTAEIHNLLPLGGSNLLISFGENMAMAAIPANKTSTSYGPVNFVALASADGTAIPFSIFCSLDRF